MMFYQFGFLSVSQCRRDILGWCGLGFVAETLHVQPARAVEPPMPSVGSCVECIGEVNGGLNACTLESPSCVSTQNDDENHFVPPWAYGNDGMDFAVEELITVATGGRLAEREAGPESADLQESRSRRAKVRQASIRAAENERACFNGRLESRHRTDDGSEYLHIVFNGDNNEQAKPACRNLGVIDAEFIFLSGDNIVDLRTASRENPGVKGGSLSLSMSYGVQYDTNVAKREMEELRKALRWEQVPVVTDFDPRFNQRRPLFFERLYQPFLPQQNKQDFEDIQDK